MKGGIGLGIVGVMMAIIIIFALVWFGDFGQKAYAIDCERVIFDKINNWLEKMSLRSMGPFDDEILIHSCVEYIDADPESAENGIKFDSGAMSKFTTLSKNIEDSRVVFSATDTSNKRIYPRPESYYVVVDPKSKIIHISSAKPDADTMLAKISAERESEEEATAT